MKKKKLKNLSLNKIKISKISNADQIKGGDTLVICTVVGSYLVCSLLLGSCDCPEPPKPVLEDPDNTRGCPSWNVAC